MQRSLGLWFNGEKMKLKEIDTANRDVFPSVTALFFFFRDALLFSSRVLFLVVRKSGCLVQRMTPAMFY
jgi:hypothetical protein